jgi:type I restriction enzyme S subunit
MIRRQAVSIGELERRGAITEIQDGNHGDKHPVASDYVSDGVPFLMASDIRDGVVDLKTCKFISREQSDSLRIGFARSGDVLLTHKGTVGNVAILPEIEDYVMLTPQVTYYRVNPQKLSNRYLHFAFCDPGFQDRLVARSAQSTRPYIGITAQRDLEISWCDRREQEQIAFILSAYDNLIENNTRRIMILEEMAKMIYREWFVNFRFPGWQKVRFTKSVLGPIPNSWRVVVLGDLVNEIIDYRGKTPKKLGADWSQNGVPALSALNVKQGRLENMDKAKFVDEVLYRRWMKSELDAGDILMTSEAPLGELYFLPERRRYCLSQRIFSIRANPERIRAVLLYFALSSHEGQKQIHARASGTTVLGIRQTDLRQIPLLCADSRTQDVADAMLQPVLCQIDILQRTNANLRQTRGLLLPKLISGEIDVEHFEAEAVAQTV